jgi:hypothetical protein
MAPESRWCGLHPLTPGFRAGDWYLESQVRPDLCPGGSLDLGKNEAWGVKTRTLTRVEGSSSAGHEGGPVAIPTCGLLPDPGTQRPPT